MFHGHLYFGIFIIPLCHFWVHLCLASQFGIWGHGLAGVRFLGIFMIYEFLKSHHFLVQSHSPCWVERKYTQQKSVSDNAPNSLYTMQQYKYGVFDIGIMETSRARKVERKKTKIINPPLPHFEWSQCFLLPPIWGPFRCWFSGFGRLEGCANSWVTHDKLAAYPNLIPILCVSG